MLHKENALKRLLVTKIFTFHNLNDLTYILYFLTSILTYA